MTNIKELLNNFYNGEIENGVFASKNEQQEDVVVSVNDKYVNFDTIQQNGWIRRNTYYKDGTSEETYVK